MKQVMFDEKMCKLARVTPNKWYPVVSEWQLGYKLVDDKGLLDDFPKVWVKLVKEDYNVEDITD